MTTTTATLGQTTAKLIRDALPVGDFYTYTEKRWTAIVTVNTNGDITKRREMGDKAEYVEHYKFDEATNTWVLHGPSWGPDQHETWENGELVANNNVGDEYTMRTVGGTQIITDLRAVLVP